MRVKSPQRRPPRALLWFSARDRLCNLPPARGGCDARAVPRSSAAKAGQVARATTVTPPSPECGLRLVRVADTPLDFPASNTAEVQFNSVAQSCPTLCDPKDCSTPGFPVHHQFPEFTQTQVHRVGDAIQPSSVVPFSSCLQSFPASGSFPMRPFFASGGSSIRASPSASVLPMNIQC